MKKSILIPLEKYTDLQEAAENVKKLRGQLRQTGKAASGNDGGENEKLSPPQILAANEVQVGSGKASKNSGEMKDDENNREHDRESVTSSLVNSEDPPPASPSDHESVERGQQRMPNRVIVRSLPYHMRADAEKLLAFIVKNGAKLLGWDIQGRMIYNGQPVVNTHISELVLDLFDEETSEPHPFGFSIFRKALEQIGAPANLLTATDYAVMGSDVDLTDADQQRESRRVETGGDKKRGGAKRHQTKPQIQQGEGGMPEIKKKKLSKPSSWIPI